MAAQSTAKCDVLKPTKQGNIDDKEKFRNKYKTRTDT
jgi:hypothetical protein